MSRRQLHSFANNKPNNSFFPSAKPPKFVANTTPDGAAGSNDQQRMIGKKFFAGAFCDEEEGASTPAGYDDVNTLHNQQQQQQQQSRHFSHLSQQQCDDSSREDAEQIQQQLEQASWEGQINHSKDDDDDDEYEESHSYHGGAGFAFQQNTGVNHRNNQTFSHQTQETKGSTTTWGSREGAALPQQPREQATSTLEEPNTFSVEATQYNNEKRRKFQRHRSNFVHPGHLQQQGTVNQKPIFNRTEGLVEQEDDEVPLALEDVQIPPSSFEGQHQPQGGGGGGLCDSPQALSPPLLHNTAPPKGITDGREGSKFRPEHSMPMNTSSSGFATTAYHREGLAWQMQQQGALQQQQQQQHANSADAAATNDQQLHRRRFHFHYQRCYGDENFVCPYSGNTDSYSSCLARGMGGFI